MLLHELGHHADWASHPSRGWVTGGEEFAEGYALRTAPKILAAYMAEFGQT